MSEANKNAVRRLFEEVWNLGVVPELLIGRASRAEKLPASAEIQVDLMGTDKLLGMECAFCHCVNGPREIDL